MKKFRLIAGIALIGLCLTFTASAQQPRPEWMPNVEVESTYERAGTVVAKFVDGKMEYAFTSGNRRGAGGTDLPYRSSKIGEDMYLVSWHDEKSPNYITVVFDFANMKEYTTAIMFYGKDMQQEFLTSGVINKFTWIE